MRPLRQITFWGFLGFMLRGTLIAPAQANHTLGVPRIYAERALCLRPLKQITLWGFLGVMLRGTLTAPAQEKHTSVFLAPHSLPSFSSLAPPLSIAHTLVAMASPLGEPRLFPSPRRALGALGCPAWGPCASARLTPARLADTWAYTESPLDIVSTDLVLRLAGAISAGGDPPVPAWLL